MGREDGRKHRRGEGTQLCTGEGTQLCTEEGTQLCTGEGTQLCYSCVPSPRLCFLPSSPIFAPHILSPTRVGKQRAAAGRGGEAAEAAAPAAPAARGRHRWRQAAREPRPRRGGISGRLRGGHSLTAFSRSGRTRAFHADFGGVPAARGRPVVAQACLPSSCETRTGSAGLIRLIWSLSQLVFECDRVATAFPSSTVGPGLGWDSQTLPSRTPKLGTPCRSRFRGGSPPPAPTGVDRAAHVRGAAAEAEAAAAAAAVPQDAAAAPPRQRANPPPSPLPPPPHQRWATRSVAPDNGAAIEAANVGILWP